MTNYTVPPRRDLMSRVIREVDDFARQPLLPRKLSQAGPALAWADLDADGREDLIIGTGRNGKVSLLRNATDGFHAWTNTSLNLQMDRDTAGIVSFVGGEGYREIVIGLSNYEGGTTNAACARTVAVRGGKIEDGAALPAVGPTTGPLAVADVDGDGGLDLFVGGRVIPGRYPEAASSRLFRKEAGIFALDLKNTGILAGVGLITGAVFADLDSDGDPDLVLACEWGPIRVFQNAHGLLHEVTSEWGLEAFVGWWNSVNVGDFDGDGRMDIVAGNWGANSFYNQSGDGKWRIAFGDFNGEGRVQILESYFDAGMKKIVPWRDFQVFSDAVPALKAKFSSHRQWANAGAAEILPGQTKTIAEKVASTLRSHIFLNRGARFEALELPLPAQIAPAMGLSVADFDGDGREDLFISQNFFAVRVEDDRQDAGRGLLLKGKGDGRFDPVAGQESGIEVYGEQRSSAVGDFDNDGRVDLAVTQNGAETKLFRNRLGKEGLRVKLIGPASNPGAIGAVLRLASEGGQQGAARQIQCGGGYWSQDGEVQVLGFPQQPAKLHVRWPGGRETVSPLSAGVRDLTVDTSGRVHQIR